MLQNEHQPHTITITQLHQHTLHLQVVPLLRLYEVSQARPEQGDLGRGRGDVKDQLEAGALAGDAADVTDGGVGQAVVGKVHAHAVDAVQDGGHQTDLAHKKVRAVDGHAVADVKGMRVHNVDGADDQGLEHVAHRLAQQGKDDGGDEAAGVTLRVNAENKVARGKGQDDRGQGEEAVELLDQLGVARDALDEICALLVDLVDGVYEFRLGDVAVGAEVKGGKGAEELRGDDIRGKVLLHQMVRVLLPQEAKHLNDHLRVQILGRVDVFEEEGGHGICLGIGELLGGGGGMGGSADAARKDAKPDGYPSRLHARIPQDLDDPDAEHAPEDALLVHLPADTDRDGHAHAVEQGAPDEEDKGNQVAALKVVLPGQLRPL